MLNLLFHLTFLSLIGGQFLRFSRGELNIYLSDILLIIFAIFGIVTQVINKKFYIPKTLGLFLVFALVSAVALVYNSERYSLDQVLVAASYIVRFCSIVGSAIVISNLISLGAVDKSRLTEILIYYVVIFCAIGFVQYIVLPDFSVLNPELGWDPHKNRLASSFFDPNFAGAFITLGIAALFYKLEQKDFKLAFYDILSGLTLLSALVLTYSRSAWLMFGVFVFAVGLKYKRILVLAVLILVLAYAAVPRIQTRISGTTDPADSAHFRFISWQNALVVIENNPVLGVGFNAYRYAQANERLLSESELKANSAAGTDSSFLLVLATTGVIGFIFYLLAFLSPIVISKGDYLTFAITASIAVESQFINSLFYPQIFVLYLLVIMVVAEPSRKQI